MRNPNPKIANMSDFDKWIETTSYDTATSDVQLALKDAWNAANDCVATKVDAVRLMMNDICGSRITVSRREILYRLGLNLDYR